MTNRRSWSIGTVALVATIALGVAHHAEATLRFGDLQVSGNLQSQNLVRTPDATTWEFIQQRNTARLRFEYDWLKGGNFLQDKYKIPFIRDSKLTVYWRGVYDSVYDTTPGFVQKTDIHGRAYASGTRNLNYFDYAHNVGFTTARGTETLSYNQLGLAGLGRAGRNAYKFENQLREAFIDLKFRSIPLSVRAGKQQIVWGETDNFRMLDRVNPLDLTWHFQQEIPAPAFGWDEIRQPLWMLKFLYQLGNLGPISQAFLEWYWNPGDWRPARQGFLPTPWGLPFYDPLTNPVDGVFFVGPCAASGVEIRSGAHRGQLGCTRLMGGTQLFGQGNYSRNPLDNSQVGVRFHGITPQGLEFTLNYLYQRWAGDDGTNYAPLRGLANTTRNVNRASRLYDRGIFPAEQSNPYVHTIGMSANYSDETYTQAVFRLETVYDHGIPFFDLYKVTVVDTPPLPGVTKKDMWKGMIAFDRPTWIKSLNKKTTVFLTGQFFWHHLLNNPGCRGQDVSRISPVQRQAEFERTGASCLVGGLDLPSVPRIENSFRDKIRDWEALFTLAAFTFYRGGSIVPVLGMAVDPVNQWNMDAFWTVDYVVRDDFVVNLAQRWFITPRGYSTPIFETWGLGGLNRGRTETSLRLTYQF
jgi:hypothetical protein